MTHIHSNDLASFAIAVIVLGAMVLGALLAFTIIHISKK